MDDQESKDNHQNPSLNKEEEEKKDLSDQIHNKSNDNIHHSHLDEKI